MIFVTVGSLWPFDRLIDAVDAAIADGLITEPVYAQVGNATKMPKRQTACRTMDNTEFDEKVQQCSFLVAHAGIGTIITALQYAKPVIVMPRRKQYGEHVNDHQYSTAVKFGEAGHVLVASDGAELRLRLAEVRSFTPKPREAQPDAIARRIARFIADIAEQ